MNEIINYKRFPGIILALKIGEVLNRPVEEIFILEDDDWE